MKARFRSFENHIATLPKAVRRAIVVICVLQHLQLGAVGWQWWQQMRRSQATIELTNELMQRATPTMETVLYLKNALDWSYSMPVVFSVMLALAGISAMFAIAVNNTRAQSRAHANTQPA